ncbi:hypothetical protein ABT294_32940 [Nonomuraea sp. NPDC000554]|uniref:hypothetical protein n=1 Tax=Nonomuraea sp. NPDC000554 TaxID=3154259 RepID=UPI00332E8C41
MSIDSSGASAADSPARQDHRRAESRTSKPALVAAQLCAAWAVGAVALPMAMQALAMAAFAGGMGLVGVFAVLGALTVLPYLIVVITVTRRVSALGATGGRRALWAPLVMGGGTAGWALGRAVTDVAGLGVNSNTLLTFLLGRVPYSLAAGILLRGRRFSTAALGLSVLLIGVGVVILRHEPTAQQLEAMHHELTLSQERH